MRKTIRITTWKFGAVVFALKIWRHYLYGKCVVFTNHKSLQHILDQKKLNIRLRRWLELLSDYDCEIRYHPGKANILANALSRKERIKPLQVEAMKEEKIKEENLCGMNKEFETCPVGTLYIKKWSWLPHYGGLRDLIMKELYKSKSFIHLGSDKMYHDLKKLYWWPNMKEEIATYVSPLKGVIRFGKRGKLNPRYIGPFKILAKIGTVAYRLELPKQLSRVHITLHGSSLKKCLSDETFAIPLDEIQIDDKLHFVEEPVEILDREVKHLKQSRILIVKVRWNLRRCPKFTWEREDQFQKKYPHLFANPVSLSNTTT
ncbi:putative reverse transcriptase domain-containing protein [Tanacetum coccineum]|uniref:Reverse transcriptase domain-containing protein n=1 Tax=Tanacetum coccineum TaxID=301880 RepID=A0ABQ5GR84_9ASTR